MGSLNRKFEGEIEIRATAADVHHEMFESKPHHVTHAAPHYVESCVLHEGQLGKPGSIILWKYNTGGKPLTAKNKILEVDNKNKLVSQEVLEGDLKEEYKTFIATCQVIPKDRETCIVKWTLEYEKLHAGIPEPTALLDTLLATAKHIDDHHHGIKK